MKLFENLGAHIKLSSILNNHSLLLLVTVSAIISIFIILPAIKDSNGYLNRFKIAVILAIILGFIFGILKSIPFVISNRYLQYKMYYLIAYVVSSSLNHYLFITLGTVMFVFITLPTIQAFLNTIGMSRKASNIIACGIVPSLLILTVGGYWINKLYLPGFFELKSIVGNAIWALTSMLLGWAVGWLILKISQIKFNFSPKYLMLLNAIKGCSFVILGLVVLSNLAPHFYFRSLKADCPNLILISIDTLRADHLGYYGHNRNTTPNIDRFAKDGVLFLNTIAQASATLPSHMSLFTGLYPSSHGVITKDRKLSDGRLTLAEILQNAGYETTAFTDGGYVNRKFGYQGFDQFDNGSRYPSIENTYIKAVNWLRKRHSRRFFLFLHTYQVHSPYGPPPTYDIYSAKNYHGVIKLLGDKLSEGKLNRIKPQMTHQDYLYVIDKYDGDIYYTDHFLGKLFKELRDLGLYDKSIIVLTSDHGENLSDHPTYDIGHGETLYDVLVKVPLIIKAPMFPRNQIIDAQVETIDIMPTVLEFLGIPIPDKIDGESLVELVKKGSYDKVFAFGEIFFKSGHHKYRMIRSDNWKLLLRSENSLELYDLKNDPKEQRNLVTGRVEIVKSLYERLHTWMDVQEEKSKELSSETVLLDDELREKLKDLGYMN